MTSAEGMRCIQCPKPISTREPGVLIFRWRTQRDRLSYSSLMTYLYTVLGTSTPKSKPSCVSFLALPLSMFEILKCGIGNRPCSSPPLSMASLKFLIPISSLAMRTSRGPKKAGGHILLGESNFLGQFCGRLLT